VAGGRAAIPNLNTIGSQSGDRAAAEDTNEPRASAWGVDQIRGRCTPRSSRRVDGTGTPGNDGGPEKKAVERYGYTHCTEFGIRPADHYRAGRSPGASYARRTRAERSETKVLTGEIHTREEAAQSQRE
jgi:hypothetical protein